ncbi:DUF2332 domain-containing protein [Solicola gregarius]|uniref:DUF2332 domain-containing protein n=1 Tax=Solicola gregarius TaxID=2908642 RepID=A0AA46TJ99_9ACTN|nr:DUF2332 domain-containing protein [Solicola gregarius]UYM06153.1 DUF2332 domain-containing protein [Solicola gregarius]
MYAELLDRLADDLDAGGVTAQVIAGHEDDPGPNALALRLLGGLHRLVLTERTPDLAAYYPTVGGRWDLAGVWPHVRAALADHRAQLAATLDQAPQTNEVGRSAALLGGLLRVADRFMLPIRLCEIGASAGLNLRADHFRYTFRRFDPTVSDPGTAAWGPESSPVQLDDAWSGPLPPLDAPLQIVQRYGADIAPVDPATTDGRVTIESYVWPDMAERVSRVRGALAVARAVPAEVRPLDAVSAVRALELVPETATVLWHSVMWQYLPAADRAAIEDRIAALGERGTAEMPFAHLSMEPSRRASDAAHEFLVVLTTWPWGERTVIGSARPHGIPTTWEAT